PRRRGRGRRLPAEGIMDLVSRYLVRIWPSGGEPPEMIQSEMCCPESVTSGQPGNDRAEIRAIRNWAQQHANADGICYSFEVCRDSMVAALSGGGSSHRVVQRDRKSSCRERGEVSGVGGVV